ncbi:MAG: O-antigen ligase family protein [Pseudomonadota bacterium]
MADVAELSQAATSSENAMSSIPFVMFLGGLYLCAAWMLAKTPKTVGALLVRQWPLVLLMLYVAASIAWSYHPEKVISNTVHSFGALFVAMAAAIHYRHQPHMFARHLSLVLGINMAIHLAATMVLPSYTIDWQDRMHGLTTHPNTLGAMAFTTVWVNVVVLICDKASKFYLRLFFVVLGVVAMVGADSVTSMMTTMATVLSIYLINRLQKIGVGRKFYFTVFGLLTIVTLVIITIGSTFDFSGLFSLFGRDANLTGRTDVWADAFKAIAEHPLLGWSFDDHAYLIAQGMPYTSYHNGILDVAVSGGLLSLALIGALFLTWGLDFTKASRVSGLIAPLSASFFIGYQIHNLTEASLIAPRGQMWEIFLVLLLLGTCRRPPQIKTQDSEKSAFSSTLKFSKMPNAINPVASVIPLKK